MSDKPVDDSDPTDAAIEEYLRLLDGGGEVDRTAFLAAHPESAEALRSFFGSVSLLQQLAGPGGLAGTDTSGALTRPPRGLNFTDEDATDSRLPWTTLPAMFGRYRVESLLGRGAMGEVYRAHDTQLDRPVALKLSHFPRNTVLELRERLLQEARAAANLSHPNICRVYDVGQIDGTRFIAMELIEGRPLADYIRTNRLPPPKTAATLIRKLALALQMAHDKGIVHRDLKPTNVIVKADHEPILMDFGLAQRPVPIGGERLTKEGTLIGSPAYMSPEQARADGSTIGPTSDIYSLGVVLYELLTGQLPFTGSVMTILAKVLSEEPPMLHSIRPEIDRDLSDICRKMLAKRPEERFTSMNEVAEALQRWLKSAAKSSRELAVKTESTASPAPLRKLTPGQVESLTLSARRCVKHHDYVQATKLLESIPYSQHSDESRSLLSKAQELGDEVELLIADMDQAVSLKQLETLPATLTRLLKLRPGYLPAKELLDRINSYGRGERRSFRFSQSGELLPGNPEEALFHGVGRMMVMLLLFGVVVFAGTSWYVWSYLLDPLRTVQVEIDDPTVTVVIDDQTVALSEGKGEVRLRSGNHGWTALKEGLALKSAKFSVGKDHAGTLVIRLNSESQEVVNLSSIVKEITSKTTGMKLALIPAGTFLMGSPATEELRSQDEGPQHSVQISKSFYMGIHEVTQRQYEAVMGRNPSAFSRSGRNSGRVKGMETIQFPVEHVSWFDAIEFCNKLSEKDGLPAYYSLTDVIREASTIRLASVSPNLGGDGYRLPTEAEWEYACRASTSTPFHFGGTSNGRESNVEGDFPYGTTIKGPSLRRTTTVGSYKQNAFGLFDMHGNVWEWCFDVYDNTVYTGRTGTTVDPIKSGAVMDRALRGGSWMESSKAARSAYRGLEHSSGIAVDHLGFRVVRGVSGTINELATNRLPQGESSRIESVSELNTIANEQSLWVSPTGLRIYFERDGQIWLASRKSKAEKFGAATTLFAGRHPTLSAAETQIYFVVPGQLGELQVRRRANIDSPFGIATAVLTLVQNPSAKCPSLSVDGLSMVFTSRDSAGVHRIMLTERLTRSSEWEVAKSIKLVDHSEPDKLSWPRLIDGGNALLLNDESDSGGHRFVTFTSQGSDSYRKSSYLNDRNLSASDLSKLAGRSLSYCAATDELYFTSTRSQRFQRNADGLITDDWQIFRLTKVSQALPGNLAHFMKPLNASQKQDSGATAPKAGQLAGEKWAGNGLQMEFCWCPPGSFTMGSPASEPNRHENEGPVSVRLTSGFWQGKYEVTQQEWQAVMGTTIRQQATRSGKGISGEEGARFPMYFVDHTEATEFCIKLTETERRAGRVPVGWTYRLPSEAEWEYACRAGTTTATAFGNSLSSTQANFDGRFPYNGAEKGNIRLTETEVGSFQPNQWGFYDMHGNVHEWCADWYVEKLPGGQNPVVLQAASIRVYRGGSRYNFGEYCRSATRDMPTSHFPWFAIGFRVALGPDLQPQPFAVPTKTNASVATSATPKPPSPPSKPKLIPLYKIVFPSEVMLTANTDEVKQLQKAYPGKWNGKSGTHVAMLGYGFAEQQPGTVLLRRYLVSPGRAHAFATRPINNSRFKEEGLGVWVSEQKSPGTSLWIGFAHNKGAPMEFDLESATASFKKIGYTPTSFQFYLFDKP